MTAVAPLAERPVSTSASSSRPVLYSGSRHACYIDPDALTVRRAEQQMTVRVVNPMATVRRFTPLPLTAVIVDRTKRETGVLHPWIIDYVFGHAPDLGLHRATVGRSARFLVIGEAIGRIPPLNGIQEYNTPRFERIRVNSRGRAIWHVVVNLPHRNVAMTVHSTLPNATLERLITALMQQPT